jgi:DNA-entry nuclease
MNDKNDATMLYYEMQLRSWVNLTATGKANQGLWLDYKVTPLYSGDELLPRQVRLDYVGVKSDGSLVTIDLPTPNDTVAPNGITYVILDNTSDNASINYLTGSALGTVIP